MTVHYWKQREQNHWLVVIKKNKQVIGQLPRGGKNLSLVGNITLTFYCKYKKQKTMEGSISSWFY